MSKPVALTGLRRNPLGLGLLALWLVVLGLLVYGIVRLYGRITHTLP